MPQFEHAPTDGIDKYRAVADDFMRRIFEMEPDSYLITDESILTDFLDMGEDRAMPGTLAKIEKIYGDVIVEKSSDLLVAIFRRIAENNEWLNSPPIGRELI